MAGEYDTRTLSAHFAAISQRFGLIEEQLAVLSDKLGVPYVTTSSSVPPEVVELARAGKTLEAAQRHRTLTSAGLDEAQRVVAGL